MILFGYERQEETASKYVSVDISEAVVRSVAQSSLIKVGIHTIAGLVISLALLDAGDKMSGFNSAVINILSSLASFYVLFGIFVLYAIYKTRRQAIKAARSQLSYYNENLERRRTFWITYRELFPPNWK